MPKHAGPDRDPVEWRKLSDYLWVGTSDDGPVGTIERGRRYYAIDTSGCILARCHDLGTAQAALAHHADALRATERSSAAGAPGSPARVHAA